MVRLKAMTSLVGLCFLLLAAAGCGLGQPAKYPSKPVDLIVAAAPGGGTDNSARLLAPYATKKFGTTVNVINVAGASGVTGMLQGVNATPDGYTMLMEGAFISSLMYAVRTDLPKALEDRTFIAQATDDYVLYAVNKDTGWNTVDDMVRAIKSRPADFKWGAGVFGSSTMFASINFFMGVGLDLDTIKKMNMVNFEQGNAPTLQALVKGDVQMGNGLQSELEPLLSTGKLKLLATTSPKRMEKYPDVPTTKELGYPAADFTIWYGVSGPKGLPDNVVKAWDDLVREGGSDSELQGKAAAIGKAWVYIPAADFKAKILKQYEQGKTVATALGLRK